MESMHPFSRMLILICLLFTLCSCSLIGGFFGAIFGVFGDVLNLGIENLPRLLPYLLFFVERQDLPEEEQIFLAQQESSEILLTPASHAIAHAVEYYQPAMVIAIPDDAQAEQQRERLLQKLKGKKVHMVRVNASDLVDHLVPLEPFGKILSDFKLTVVAPEALKALAQASYQPKSEKLQQWQQEISTLLEGKTASSESILVTKGASIKEIVPTY